MDTTPPSTEYLEFVDDVLQRWPEVEPGQMFGVPNLKHRRKAFAAGYAGGAVFRLPANTYQHALELDGAQPFDPAERGTPMGTWIMVPTAHIDHWMTFATLALSHLTPTAESRNRP